MISLRLAVLIITFSLAIPQYLPAQENTGTADEDISPVTITSDSVKISKESGWMDYTGEVRFTKGNTILTADKMSYNTRDRIARVEGNVLLIRGEFSIACDKMTYNVKEDSGIAEFVLSYTQSWYGWGKEIIRVSKDEYHIMDGYITTDPYPEPGWRIEAKEIKLFPGDKITSKHITMYVGNMPVMYLPFYRVSLEEKHSPLSVEVGHTEEWGTYALVAYDLLLNGGLHTIFHLDYRSEKKWAEGIDIVGYQQNGGKFKSTFYYADDKNRIIELVDGEEISVEDERHRTDLKGYHPFKDSWDIRYELHKFSDEDFLKDFFRKEYEDDSQPETYINVSKYHPNWTFNMFGKKQVNDFYTTTERLPDVSMEFANRRIGQTPFYHDGIDSMAFLRQIDENKAIETYDALRFDAYHRFSYPRKYIGWLNIVPRVGLRGTYYGDNPQDESDVRYMLDTDVNFFTKIFKMWDHDDPARNIHDLRHVIEPNIHYFYTPTPNIEPEELFQFDEIDELDYRNSFRLGVRNKLQTKRHRRTWDLVDLNVYVDFFPDLDEYDDMEDDRHFSDVVFDLEIFPSRNFKIELDSKVDTYDNEITTFNTQLSFYESDMYGINFEYRYRADESNLFATEGYLQFNHEYAAKAYLRYEEETGELEEAEVTLFKDLRTWVGALSFRHREDEEDNQVWLTFYLKALPNSPIIGGN